MLLLREKEENDDDDFGDIEFGIFFFFYLFCETRSNRMKGIGNKLKIELSCLPITIITVALIS
jgi:hypothetical protein